MEMISGELLRKNLMLKCYFVHTHLFTTCGNLFKDSFPVYYTETVQSVFTGKTFLKDCFDVKIF